MLTDIISTLTGAITSFATTASQAIVTNFDTLVMNAEGDGLSNVAIWGLCFMGVSLVIGLGRLVFNVVRNRG